MKCTLSVQTYLRTNWIQQNYRLSREFLGITPWNPSPWIFFGQKLSWSLFVSHCFAPWATGGGLFQGIPLIRKRADQDLGIKINVIPDANRRAYDHQHITMSNGGGGLMYIFCKVNERLRRLSAKGYGKLMGSHTCDYSHFFSWDSTWHCSWTIAEFRVLDSLCRLIPLFRNTWSDYNSEK